MSRNKDSDYVISLAESDTPYTIPKLLRHAVNDIRKNGPPRVYVHDFSLHNADNLRDESAYAHVAYWCITKSMKDSELEALEFRKEIKIAPPIKEVTIYPDKNVKSKLHMLEYRLPQDDKQSDTLLLLESLASYLEDNKINSITDLVLHDYLDEDALSHPFVRVYYKDS